jgi:protein required for attachment to host cells
MHATWILVSDASRARLFRRKGVARTWDLVFERDYPEGRAHGRDRTTDRPGRFALDHGKGFQAQMEPPKSPHEIAAENFARSLAESLERGLGAHAFDRLVLTAPPHFLGLLRERLSTEVARHVTASIDKDYTRLELPELRNRLREVV